MKFELRFLPCLFVLLFNSVLTVVSQGICENYVRQNKAVVDQRLLRQLDNGDIPLQRVVACLEDGGSLTFSEPTFEIETLQIENSIRIRGSLDETTRITCVDGPTFIVNAIGVEMSNLEIRNCQLNTQDAPITVKSRGNLELNSVNFTNNTNVVGPAAVRLDEGAQLNIEDCNFERNSGVGAHAILAGPDTDVTLERSAFRYNSGNGSAIYITDGNSLTMSNSRLVNNRADLGGGALIIDARTTVIIEEASEFRGNEALTAEGGAIFAIGNVSLAIAGDAIFRRNIAAYQGGALFFSGHSTLTIEDAFFVENESNFSGGGAIYAQNSMNEDLDIQIYNTIFSKNSVTSQLGSGGAIRLQGPRITCNIERGVSFISNVAELDGAAIHISDGPEVNISAASFVGNEAHEGGGSALFILSTAYSGSSVKLMTLRIMSSMFIHNRAVYGRRGGGTIGSTGMGAQIFIDGCKFHENRALFGSGGVFYLFEGPFTTVRNSSFVDNKAVWGGVIYGQVEASVNMSDCIFHRNEAEEGGAISTRGAISIDIVESDFTNNSAKEEGGAIRAEKNGYYGGDTARLTISNSRFLNNNAGYEIREGGLDIESTRGGGIAAIGSGQYIDIADTILRNNFASEGGAVAAIGPGKLMVSGQTIFENNVANFGSAIFIFVNDNINIWGGTYRITGARFFKNTAKSGGGAVRIASLAAGSNRLPYNANRRTVVFHYCAFRYNKALNHGGGLMVTGVGLALNGVSFTRNTALRNANLSMSGSGGGIAAIDGASVRITSSSITHNRAYLSGGGLFVMDSSVAVEYSNFTQNSIREEHGNGGAVALKLTANRLLPILESGGLQLPILFECNYCKFVRNTATLYGGAIYHHNLDPYADYTEDWNCERTDISTFTELQNAPEFNLTCLGTIQTRDRLRSRAIRIARVLFKSNRAQSGAALFTSNPVMIRITNGEAWHLGNSFIDTVKNESALNEFRIIFRDNEKAEDGYGLNYATFPRFASLHQNNGSNNSTHLIFFNFRSGDYLNFDMEVKDYFKQTVSYMDNFTAELHAFEKESDNRILDLYGKTKQVLDGSGKISFTGARFNGKENESYNLTVRFFYKGQELNMAHLYIVEVKIRQCIIGEVTLTDENGAIECIHCIAGQFSFDGSSTECQSCEGIEGIECYGNTAVPKDHYWHSSSVSRTMLKCINPRACKYENRTSRINEYESWAHSNGKQLFYSNNDNVQCALGYQGILCGSCQKGYGRDGDQCQSCDVKALGYFVASLLIMWPIALVGYFIRSVLQLSKRLDFNKTFGESLSYKTERETLESSQESSLNLSELENDDICPDEITHLAFEMCSLQERNMSNTLFPQSFSYIQASHLSRKDWTKNLTSRRDPPLSKRESKKKNSSSMSPREIRDKDQARLATRFQRLKSGGSSRDPKTLTLVNPASEVLKIIINFLQLTSVAVFINVTWSKEVRKVLDAIGTMANLSTGGGYFSLDCFLEPQPFAKSLQRMVILVLYPFFIFIIFVIIWALRTIIKRKTMKYFRHRIWVAFLAIIYFFYTGLTKNLLRFFVCFGIQKDTSVQEDLGLYTDSEWYLWEEDTSVQCYKNEHLLLVMFFVVPLLCLITIGYPLGTLLILHFKVTKTEDEKVVGTYGFLYQAYNKHYWEVTIMFRKATIAAVTVFPQELGANVQGLLCLFILFVSLVCQLYFQPFKKEVDHLNQLESFSLSATIGVFFSGLVFNDPKTGGVTDIILTVLALLLIFGTLLLMIYHLFRSSEEVLDMLLLEKGVMDCDQLLTETVSTKLKQLCLHYVSAAARLLQFGKRNRNIQKRQVKRTQASVQLTDYT